MDAQLIEMRNHMIYRPHLIDMRFLPIISTITTNHLGLILGQNRGVIGGEAAQTLLLRMFRAFLSELLSALR